MSGTDIFVDTNICIYLLNGDITVANILQNQNIFISFITEIELYAFHGNNNASVKVLNEFINSVTVVNIDNETKLQIIELRKTYRLKLPDCIIAASALVKKTPLLTADKGFQKVKPLDLLLYEFAS